MEKLPKSWFSTYPTILSYLRILQTHGGMSTNFEENNNALIILQFYVIATCCNEPTFAMIWCNAIVKPRTTKILCLCSSIMCVARSKKKNMRKMKRKKKKQKKCQPNPLTWESHIFINWKFNPTPLDTLIVPYKRIFFL